jgi:two-component system chemotaxis sensor kinase CheA
MDDSILEIFREEARDHLSGLEKGFLDLESAGSSEARRGLIDHLFRHAHSLKGDAKALAILPIKEASQRLEDLLDDLRGAPDSVNRQRIDQSLAIFDEIREAVESWDQQTRPAHSKRVESDEAALADESPPANSDSMPGDMPPEQPAPEKPASPGSGLGRGKLAKGEAFTVRVPAERLDRMLNLAGEVRIALRAGEMMQNRLAEFDEQLAWILEDLSRLEERDLRQLLETSHDQIQRLQRTWHNQIIRQERLAEGLEADIRQARLLPLVMLADAMRRTVRDLSHSLQKDIHYEVDVGKILLDKAVIEGLREPLLHLIRNAADHGIEPAAERVQQGKKIQGLIRVQARQRGQFVHVLVSDDGGGLDYERIRQRIRRMQLLKDDEIGQLTDEDLVPYLFHPGFTTSDVGDVSGRGVGLDVVFSSIRSLQGTTRLVSTSSAGTCFEMKVPVSVSTIRTLTVFAAGQPFGIGIAAVERTGQANQEDLLEIEGAPMVRIGGHPLPWYTLAGLLGLPGIPPGDSNRASPYLLVRDQERFTAIGVDGFEDESEILLKRLGFPLDGLPGLVGGTIRPDGSVQLVLELGPFLRQGARPAAHPMAVPPQSRRILLVDDSPTTRAILRNLFTASGYNVTVASDGLDALDKLRISPVDLVVSDVEMPRLNGFDLTRQVKSKYGTPVILVTGREREEHRREGLEAGADAYVVKSTFEGEGLMAIVEQFL